MQTPLLPNDRRGFLFSCADAGGFEWQNDWFWRLNGEGNKYDELGLDAFQTVAFMKAVSSEPLCYFSLRFSFSHDEQSRYHWDNTKFDLRLADLLKFSSSAFPFRGIAMQGRLLGVLPNTAVLELTLEAALIRNLKMKCWLAPVRNAKPRIKSGSGKILLAENSGKALAVAGAGFKRAGQELETTLTIKGKKVIRLALSVTDGTASVALRRRAQKAMTLNLDRLEARIMKYYRGLPSPRTGNILWDKLYYKMFDDKRLNLLRMPGKKMLFECPDRPRHNSMWLWDTCFHSLVWRHYPWKQLYFRPLEYLVGLQSKISGMIPTTFGQNAQTAVSQPPLITWTLLEVNAPRTVLERCYEPLKRFHAWWLRERQVEGSGLCRWKKGGESGLDNAPLWDANILLTKPLLCVDLNCQLALDAQSLAEMARKIGKHDEAKYWEREAGQLIKKIRETFWDPRDKFFYNRFLNGPFQRIKTLTPFWAMLVGAADAGQARAMLEHLENPKEFATPYPWPSVAVNEPTFTMDYWRGPVWIHSNYIVLRGLARYGYEKKAAEFSRRIIDMLAHDYERTGYLWECYDPFTGSGEYVGKKNRGPRQIADYYCGWTALAVLLMKQFSNNSRQAI